MSTLLAVLLAGSSAVANIDLEWRPLDQTVEVGQPVGIGLYAASDSDEDQTFNSMQVIMEWDSAFLQLDGTDPTGGVGLATSAFTANDSWGFNETNPPADGDGLWFGFAPIVWPPEELPATPEGSLLTTIMFTALDVTPSTLVNMLVTAQKPGHPVCYTQIWSGTSNVVGQLGGAADVTIIPEPAGLALFAAGVLTLGVRRR
ncbi:MAG: PEP-CTERM sorting domain-containing protein [Phycisphaerae bacterium]|nr:PEP-CTERM sorting domain-containing protein [Phycisphaerae bacterium]